MTQMAGTMSDQMHRCIDASLNCHRECEQAMDHALRAGGRMVEREIMSKLMDCAEICHISANMMMRQSLMSHKMAMMCAEACRSAAEACAEFDRDEQMRSCGKAAMRCADMCEQMMRS